MGSAVLALLALCLGLGACGGSSSSTTTASTGGFASERHLGKATGEGVKRSKGAQPQASGPRVLGAASSGNAGIPPALKREAGRASSFLVPHSDNSIPTYGTEASAAQRADAQAALGAYLRAMDLGQWSRACTMMGAVVQRQLSLLSERPVHKASDCAITLAKYKPSSKRNDALRDSLAAFRVKGGRGFALFYGPHRQQFIMPMVREGGSWKVNQSIPVAYPLSPARR